MLPTLIRAVANSLRQLRCFCALDAEKKQAALSLLLIS